MQNPIFFVRTNRGRTPLALCGLLAVALALTSSGCAKKSEKTAPTSNDSATSPPMSGALPASADDMVCNCHATLGGAVSGAFDCEGRSHFFIPPSKNKAYGGNTEVALIATNAFARFKLPAGVDQVNWAGLFRGPLQAGATYTEKDLIRHGPVDTAFVSAVALHKQISGLKRVKLVVKSVIPGEVRDDATFSGGKVRSDKVSGDLELVIGNPSGEVTIRAKYD
jgi:hypothetical protein